MTDDQDQATRIETEKEKEKENEDERDPNSQQLISDYENQRRCIEAKGRILRTGIAAHSRTFADLVGVGTVKKEQHW